MAYVDDAIAQSTARAVVEQYLRSNVLAITDPAKPAGGLAVQAAGGATRSELRRIAAGSLLGFPTP